VRSGHYQSGDSGNPLLACTIAEARGSCIAQWCLQSTCDVVVLLMCQWSLWCEPVRPSSIE
jgi:hypothetical protein